MGVSNDDVSRDDAKIQESREGVKRLCQESVSREGIKGLGFWFFFPSRLVKPGAIIYLFVEKTHQMYCIMAIHISSAPK